VKSSTVSRCPLLHCCTLLHCCNLYPNKSNFVYLYIYIYVCVCVVYIYIFILMGESFHNNARGHNRPLRHYGASITYMYTVYTYIIYIYIYLQLLCKDKRSILLHRGVTMKVPFCNIGIHRYHCSFSVDKFDYVKSHLLSENKGAIERRIAHIHLCGHLHACK